MPGCGKTSSIVATIAEHDLVVCMTWQPVEDIKHSLKKQGSIFYKFVMTIEEAKKKRMVARWLIVDEAQMIDVEAILPLITADTKQLIVYGDSN